MNKDEFIGPPTIWVLFTVVGGITTALGLILALEYVNKRLSPQSTGSLVQPSVAVSVTSHLELDLFHF